ncbi:L-sorbose 1-phosphate reductase, partial [Klebsiella pneumoniae]|nr:L-sorbose 1-phosphate reductase [Klebsiella pneumoniae]
MGIGALDYALHGPFAPSLVVAVDVDADRLERLRALFPAEDAARNGTRLEVVDASGRDPVEALRALSPDGFDDVIVFAAITELVEAGG